MTEVNVEHWKQANQIYVELMDLTVSDALNRLSQMDSLDDEIKSLVLTLISTGNDPSRYFNQHVGAKFQFETDFKDTCQVGDKIGGYELQKELGVGGMAKVYQAIKTDSQSQKPVAIKLFNHPSLSAILLDRFAVEQDVLSGLSHPNIVNMHHSGSTEQGVPYIVMELIEGGIDVGEYAKSKPTSLHQKIKWMIEAAKAIAYAHNNLIIHRDIKPSNLLINENEELKVVDFGIAKLMSKLDEPQKTTIMALTPSFAAPEQINSGQISVTTDVFSLGAVCLALLIDEQPLPADRLLKSCAGDEEHIWQVLQTQIKDNDLKNILNQALQQDPKKRYRNMDLFADDLTAWIKNKPVSATRDSWFYRVSKFAKRRSALFAALSTLAVMLVMSLGVFSWQFKKIQAEATKANEVEDFMLGVFSVVNPDKALGEKIYAKDLLAQAFEDIKVKSFEDSDVKVKLLSAIGLAQSQLGLYDQSSMAYSSAIEIDPNDIFPNVGRLQIQIEQGEYELAAKQVAELEKSITIDSEYWPLFVLLQSKLASSAADFEQAQKLAKEAELIYQQRNQLKGVLSTARQLADLMSLNSEAQQAAVYLEDKLQEALVNLAPTSSLVLGIQSDLVRIYNDLGKYPQAITHAEKLIENIKNVFGEKHPFLVKAFISQSGTYRATGKIEEAQDFAEKAYDLSMEVNGLVHETTANAKNVMGVLSYVKGDQSMALVQIREAADLFERSLGPDHPDVWEVKTNLTALLNMAKKHDEGIEMIEPVFQRQLENLGKTHQSTIYTQAILIRLYGDVGRLDEAQSLGESMLEVTLEQLGEAHPLTVGGRFTLATIYQKQKKLDMAIELVVSVIDSFELNEKNERIITAYNTLADLHYEQLNVDKASEFKDKSLKASIEILGLEAPRTVVQMIKTGHHYLAINELEKAFDYVSMAEKSIQDNDIEIQSIKDRLVGLSELLEKQRNE